jgi:hypothetical protein
MEITSLKLALSIFIVLLALASLALTLYGNRLDKKVIDARTAVFEARIAKRIAAAEELQNVVQSYIDTGFTQTQGNWSYCMLSKQVNDTLYEVTIYLVLDDQTDEYEVKISLATIDKESTHVKEIPLP